MQGHCSSPVWGPNPSTCIHKFESIEEGGCQRDPLLRCIAQAPDTQAPSPFDDAIVSHMLSLQYVSQKHGLAKHVLSSTSDNVDHMYDLNYFNIDITHTNHTTQNTQHRIATLSHYNTQ